MAVCVCVCGCALRNSTKTSSNLLCAHYYFMLVFFMCSRSQCFPYRRSPCITWPIFKGSASVFKINRRTYSTGSLSRTWLGSKDGPWKFFISRIKPVQRCSWAPRSWLQSDQLALSSVVQTSASIIRASADDGWSCLPPGCGSICCTALASSALSMLAWSRMDLGCCSDVLSSTNPALETVCPACRVFFLFF